MGSDRSHDGQAPGENTSQDQGKERWLLVDAAAAVWRERVTDERERVAAERHVRLGVSLNRVDNRVYAERQTVAGLRQPAYDALNGSRELLKVSKERLDRSEEALRRADARNDRGQQAIEREVYLSAAGQANGGSRQREVLEARVRRLHRHFTNAASGLAGTLDALADEYERLAADRP